ncbi:MAG TPA: hypothetical protein VF026_09130, partial [Ktedonobacteraceae bacterium]
HGGRCETLAEQDEGDASVPTHHPSHPRPYETTPLPYSFDKNLPVKALPPPLRIRRLFPSNNLPL